MNDVGPGDDRRGEGGPVDPPQEKHAEDEYNQKGGDAHQACAEAPEAGADARLVQFGQVRQCLGYFCGERDVAIDAFFVLRGDDLEATGAAAHYRQGNVAIGTLGRSRRVFPAADHTERERLRAGLPFVGVEVWVYLHRVTRTVIFLTHSCSIRGLPPS